MLDNFVDWRDNPHSDFKWKIKLARKKQQNVERKRIELDDTNKLDVSLDRKDQQCATQSRKPINNMNLQNQSELVLQFLDTSSLFFVRLQRLLRYEASNMKHGSIENSWCNFHKCTLFHQMRRDVSIYCMVNQSEVGTFSQVGREGCAATTFKKGHKSGRVLAPWCLLTLTK